MRIGFVMLLVLLLAGCGGGETDSGGGVAVDSVNTFNAAALDDFTLLSPGTYTLSVSGAIELELGSSETFAEERPTNNFTRRVVEVGDSAQGYLVRIIFSGLPDAGTYPLAPLGSDLQAEGVFAAGLLYMLSPDPAQQFRDNIQGTITIGDDLDLLSATFEFTATSESGDRTVTVRGAFHQLRVER